VSATARRRAPILASNRVSDVIDAGPKIGIVHALRILLGQLAQSRVATSATHVVLFFVQCAIPRSFRFSFNSARTRGFVIVIDFHSQLRDRLVCDLEYA
jgi:hypothetical protein